MRTLSRGRGGLNWGRRPRGKRGGCCRRRTSLGLIGRKSIGRKRRYNDGDHDAATDLEEV